MFLLLTLEIRIYMIAIQVVTATAPHAEGIETVMMQSDEFKEISVEELDKMPREDYIILDVRDEDDYNHDSIPGSIHIVYDALMQGARDRIPKNSKLVVICKYGRLSEDVALKLNEEGYDAYNLLGGYGKFVAYNALRLANDEETRENIEKSLRKKFRKDIFVPFVKAINDYELVKPGDKIAVCISGGKDSMLMAKLFQELKRHNKIPFELEFILMDPGYNEQNRRVIENNAKLLGIPVHIFESDIFDSVYEVEKSPCYLCARMRRGHLYSKAKEYGCNKIALGHHFDDVIETILMGMLYSGQYQAMMPKLHSTNFEGMELIRPMYYVREDDIKHFRDYNGLHFIQCACKFTDTCTTCRANGDSGSKRLETKMLIAKLKETNPCVEKNIFRSQENVVLNKTLGYKLNGQRHSFLEKYDDEDWGY